MIRATALVLLVFATAAHAQQADDTARLGAGVMQNNSGRIAANQVAGQGNAQANAAAIAFSGSGIALADASVGQVAQQPAGARARSAQAVMGAGALAGSNGLLSFNQVAGSGNTQTNLFVLESGPIAATVDDGALAQNAGTQPPEWTGESPASRREARIDAGVLAGSTGVVQVNQSAGVGNSVANVIALSLSGAGGSQ